MDPRTRLRVAAEAATGKNATGKTATGKIGALAAAAAAIVAAVAGCPAALAQAPSRACAVPRAVPPPIATDKQQHYRKELHALATGAGITVAVIDTGVSRHDELPRLAAGSDFVADKTPDPFFDCDLHGSVVAGIIGGQTAGIAPDASLISIRQTSAHYQGDSQHPYRGGTLETLTKAIDEAVDSKANVVNISVVSCAPPAIAERLDTTPLDNALRRAEQAGVVIVAAGGNTSSNCKEGDVVYPGQSPTVITVSALSGPYEQAEYSLPGPYSAQGLTPVGLAPDNAWADAKEQPGVQRQAPQPFTGTSFAAPVITGVVALLQQRHPGASPADIRAILTATAHPGTGFVDPLEALSYHFPNGPVPARQLAIHAASVPASHARERLVYVLSALLCLSVSALSILGIRRNRLQRARPR